jgi:uncharacterized membrane protein SpoIIM required for sporulation
MQKTTYSVVQIDRVEAVKAMRNFRLAESERQRKKWRAHYRLRNNIRFSLLSFAVGLWLGVGMIIVLYCYLPTVNVIN